MSDTAPPLEFYFAAFAVSGFSYNPASSAHNNFARLCKVSGWVGNSPQRTEARRGFQDALVQQFNFLYGTNGKDLAAWQNLCKTIGIEPIPDTVKSCRQVRVFSFLCRPVEHIPQRVWDAHVNIVDLIEAVRLRRRVR